MSPFSTLSRVWFLVLLFSFAGLAPVLRAADASEIENGFAFPPASAQPRVWWPWLNGNVTKEGITADLEAMQRLGIHGATICVFDLGTPAGPIRYGSPEFFEMVRFAARESKRLNLELGLENGAGWSSSGGPWVTPENSMQRVTTSERTVAGPLHFSGVLAQPPTQKNFYRDIRVVAFAALEGDTLRMGEAKPKITASVPDFRGADGRGFALPKSTPAAPSYLQFEFAEPYLVRTLMLDPDPELFGAAQLEASDDGQTYRVLRNLLIRLKNGVQAFAIPSTTARFYRFVFVSCNTPRPKLQLINLELRPAERIDAYLAKAETIGRVDDNQFGPAPAAAVPDDATIHPGQEIDLTEKMEASGRLTWDVPPGKWTIVRFGDTSTGMSNHPAPPEGTGLECDKLSRAAGKTFWEGLMNKVTQDLGPLAGTGFTHTLIDSYEVGSQNWSPAFAQEFQQRRGYDLLPYLPVFTGRIVDSPEISDRVLWDVRRTVADLYADNYYGSMAELAHKSGITLDAEPYGDGPFDDLLSGRDVDRVMGEFWWPGGNSSTVKLAASVAHTYGKRIVGAESFTSADGGWDMSPPTMKALGDLAFAGGINSYDLSCYALQPWLNRRPGMMYGPFGSNFSRTNTWWEQGKAWIEYLSRCQYLLQQGLFVGDVLFFEGEGAPVEPVQPSRAVLPDGYDYDGCDADVILHRMRVQNGNLLFPDGTTYRVLALPPGKTMTPELLRRLKELADAGAAIVGPKPEESPSLSRYPGCDDEVKKLAGELWDSGEIKDEPVTQALAERKLPPDFEPADPAVKLLHIHRRIGADDLYFISNQAATAQAVDGLFRISGKVPEFWHADTGSIERVAAWSEEDGRTRVPLRLDPAGSVFVMFRAEPAPADHPVSLARSDAAVGSDPASAAHLLVNTDGRLDLETPSPGTFAVKMSGGETKTVSVSEVPPPVEVTGPWSLSFSPNGGAPAQATFDPLSSWSDSSEAGIKYFSGTATYTKTLAIPASLLGPGHRLELDLGDVEVIAEVKLNGRDLGILWKPPYSVDITDAAREGDNALEIKVVNLWPNRMIGDEQLPEDSERSPSGLIKAWPTWLLNGKTSPAGRFTFVTTRHWKKSSPLFPSGLIGPVILRSAVDVSVPPS